MLLTAAASAARLQRCARRRSSHVPCAAARGESGRRGPQEAKAPDSGLLKEALLALTPLDTEFHRRTLSGEVVEAMERTVTGMLGVLPPHQFSIQVECEREALARLLSSATMTGCMLHNVDLRFTLSRSLEWALPESSAAALQAPPESTLAAAPEEVQRYVAALEARLVAAETRAALSGCAGEGGAASATGVGSNALLSYLRGLEESQVAALSTRGSAELQGAVRSLVDSLLGRLPPDAKTAKMPSLGLLAFDAPTPAPRAEFSSLTRCSREYLGDLLLWCMMAGHFARDREQRAQLAASVAKEVEAPKAPTYTGEEWRPFITGQASA